jgi:hypothetical protein
MEDPLGPEDLPNATPQAAAPPTKWLPVHVPCATLVPKKVHQQATGATTRTHHKASGTMDKCVRQTSGGTPTQPHSCQSTSPTAYAGCQRIPNVDRQEITCWLPTRKPDDAHHANTRSKATCSTKPSLTCRLQQHASCNCRCYPGIEAPQLRQKLLTQQALPRILRLDAS